MFFERSEQAIDELSKKYSVTAHRIANNILNNRQDSEECVNDAYLGIWNAIPPQRPLNLSAFFYRIVRNLAIKKYDYNSAGCRNAIFDVPIEELEGCLTSDEHTDDNINIHELAKAIDGFLDGLPRTDRMIFIRRYFYVDTFEAIASRPDAGGLSVVTIRKRLSRIRGKLREYLRNTD